MIQRFSKHLRTPVDASREQSGKHAGEEGAIVVLAALGVTVVLLFAVMVLEQGTVFAGRTQLQHAADAGARGALMRAAQMANRRAQPMRGEELRREADAMAVAAINGGTIIATEPESREITVELGTVRRNANDEVEFTVDNDLRTPPQAARVTAKPRGGFGTLFSSRNLDASATAIAAYPCRNVALTTDLSGSFVANQPEVRRGIQAAIARIFADPIGTDGELVVVGFAGQTVVSPRFRLDNAASDLNRALNFVAALPFCEITNILNPPPCAGTDTRGGLREARRVLEDIQEDNQCINMIVLMSDGDPCVFNGRGSTKRQAFDEARTSERLGISIAPIFLNEQNRDTVDCPNPDFSLPLLSDRDFMAALASGYGTLLPSGFDVRQIAENIQDALIRIPPVLVD